MRALASESERRLRQAARWANVVVGVATVAYVFFAGLETLACLHVAWSASRRRSANAPAPARRVAPA